MNWKT